MTIQQVRYLQKLLQSEPELRLKRLAGGQIAGKLLMEIETEGRAILEQVYQTHNVHYDWIMRVEFDEKPLTRDT